MRIFKACHTHGINQIDLAVIINKLAAALVLCNEMNNTWRWVKFYIDRDGDIRVQDDAVIDLSSVGDECDELVSRMVDIIDKAYPDFMRLKWS